MILSIVPEMVTVSDDRRAVPGIRVFRGDACLGTAIPPEGDSPQCWTDVVPPENVDSREFYNLIGMHASVTTPTSLTVETVPFEITNRVGTDQLGTDDHEAMASFSDKVDEALEAQGIDGYSYLCDNSVNVGATIAADTREIAQGILNKVVDDVFNNVYGPW